MLTPTRTVASLLASLAATAALAMQATPEGKPAEPAAAQAPAAAGPVFVSLETSKGTILLELDPARAPISVENFLKYVKSGFYDNTVFHRIVANFVVQGGGFDKDLVQKPTNPPIKNEWTNGLKNAKGTISMARLPSPDTATSQFFLNLRDNSALDGANGPGYAVFGKIVVGMDVLEVLGKIPTAPVAGTDQSGGKYPLSDLPVERVMITKATEVQAEAAAKMIEDAKAAAAAAPAAPAAPAAAPAAPAAK